MSANQSTFFKNISAIDFTKQAGIVFIVDETSCNFVTTILKAKIKKCFVDHDIVSGASQILISSLFLQKEKQIYWENFTDQNLDEAKTKIILNSSTEHKFIVVSKLLAKIESRFKDAGFLIIDTSKQTFSLEEHLDDAIKFLADVGRAPLSVERKKILLSTFAGKKINGPDKLVQLVEHANFISASNSKSFARHYLAHFFDEELWRCVNYFFSKMAKKSTFLQLFAKLKNNYPDNFWLAIFMSKSWNYLGKENSKESAKKFAKFYSDCYMLNNLTKKHSFNPSIEPVLLSFLS